MYTGVLRGYPSGSLAMTLVAESSSSPKLKICRSINVPTQLHILRTTENVSLWKFSSLPPICTLAHE